MGITNIQQSYYKDFTVTLIYSSPNSRDERIKVFQIQIHSGISFLKSKSCLNPKSYHNYVSLCVVQFSIIREKNLHHNSN